MTMECVTLMKPKVRFSEQSESTDNSDDYSGPFHGPKIKSIITLDQPVKIIHDSIEEDTSEYRKRLKEESTINSLSKVGVSMCPSVTTVTSVPSLTKKNTGGKTLPVKNKLSSTNNQRICSTKSCEQSTKKTSVPPLKNSGNVKRELNTKNYIENNKENVSQRSLRSKEQTAKVGSKPSSSDKAVVIGKGQAASGVNSKTEQSVKPSIPPQMKPNNLTSTKKLLSRVKLPVGTTKPKTQVVKSLRSKSQVRSEMAKNISMTKPNVYVGPGMPRDHTRSLSSASEKGNTRADINSCQRLDRPEYNSIMTTIKKLREAERGKVVTDIASLPTSYKYSFQKKMSSALDFPPAESIFHDLIDLSITDKQLPSRLIRSKDPEPRRKDLEPNLSDFFVPQYASEYAEAVKIRPKSPQIVDNLSEYRISNRIFSWKTCLNEI